MTLRHDPVIDLGRDQKRMTPEDTRRQVATVNRLLKAFTSPLSGRRELQLLADEVGLGKTFVSLATAYNVLKMIRYDRETSRQCDLAKCYRAAVVIVPSGNHALARKWHDEVEALRTRCSVDQKTTSWFRAKICQTPYDLVDGLRRASDLRRSSACVLICTANIFTRRVQESELWFRFLTACVFRWAGSRISKHERYRMLTRAASVHPFREWSSYARRIGQGEYEAELWDFESHERFLRASSTERSVWLQAERDDFNRIPFNYSDISHALDECESTAHGEALLMDKSIASERQMPNGLIPYCREAAQRRGYNLEYFEAFLLRIRKLSKTLPQHLIQQDIPLVIVDEAHHWRHSNRQDCRSFRSYLGPKARRLLLVTATPFQMHRSELSEVLSVGDVMESAIGPERVALLKKQRELIERESTASQEAGIEFSREWGALPEHFARWDPKFDAAIGVIPGIDDRRTAELERLWEAGQVKGLSEEERLRSIPVSLRRFFIAAFRLQSCNNRLSAALSKLMVRHRRSLEHRRVLIGREYPPTDGQVVRPDQHVFHLAPGAIVPPHAELAQYLLMKVVAECNRGRRRTALGVDLTGSYTTLWQSKEGKRAIGASLSQSNVELMRLLKRLTGFRKGETSRFDSQHPKLRLVVENVLRCWDRGEKSLIFCFRIPTAETLSQLLEEAVQKRLAQSKRNLMKKRQKGNSNTKDARQSLPDFRRNLTSRNRVSAVLFLDRVLLGWFASRGLPLPQITDEDRCAVAQLYANTRYEAQRLFVERERLQFDYVFLNRALENTWAKRLLKNRSHWWQACATEYQKPTLDLLQRIADEDWVRYRYGLSNEREDLNTDDSDEETAITTIASGHAAEYYYGDGDITEAPSGLKAAFACSENDHRLGILERLATGPNLLMPLQSSEWAISADILARATRMRDLVFDATYRDQQWHWDQRAIILDALLRVLLREDILLRLPRDVFTNSEEPWAVALLRGLHQPLGHGQRESLAGRVEEFLYELKDMGPKERETHLRYARKAGAKSVQLVKGTTQNRDEIFSGFNTPMLPDILVCTQVGQEGIDLHRHCRHVIHYDLGWNPATIEQRTGRTDRIGSKAFRERELASVHRNQSGELDTAPLPGLDIGLPYLAGTYDERMFDRLRTRAQAFEILTGGDPTVDQDSESAWLNPDDEGNPGYLDYVQLPLQMLEQLRVDLAVKLDPNLPTQGNSFSIDQG